MKSRFSGLLPLLILIFAPSAAAEVRFAEGVVFQHVEAPRELGEDSTLTVEAHFTTEGPLERDQLLFVHLSPPPGSRDSRCRLVSDSELGDSPSTGWRAGPLSATVEVEHPGRCGRGPLEVHLGLFDQETGARLPVLDGAGYRDRIHVATVLVRDTGTEPDETVVLHQPPLQQPPTSPLHLPSALEAILAVLLGILGLLILRRALPISLAVLPREEREDDRWRRYLGPTAPLLIYGAGVLVCLGWVKDDAYISFRYARNLVSGRGMTFNADERVEGYTNFLWTMLMAPFEWAELDLIQVCDILGPLLGAGLLLLVTRVSRSLDGPGPLGSHLWPAMWLASSSSFTLWSVGGLEQSLAMLLPFAGAWLTWRAWQKTNTRYAICGSLALAGASLTRPEGHLFAVLIGSMLLWTTLSGRAGREGKRLFFAWLMPLIAVLGPYHLWRVMYFDSLLPNTYLVKAVSGVEVYRAGLHLAEGMLRFNGTGIVIVLALLSLLVSNHRAVRAFSVILSLLFLAYVVKVGADELMWHRLFLPALPFAVIAAAEGLRLLVDGIYRLSGNKYRVLAGVIGWLIVLGGCYFNLTFTFVSMRGNAGYGGCSGMNHPDLGKFLTRHSRPGDLVAFQDMGATPYHAPDLRFLDFVGLVDRDIARMLQHNGVHPFVPATRARRGGELCHSHRDYVFERRPEWVVLVPYPNHDATDEMAQRFHTEDPETALRATGGFRNSQLDCQLYYDPRFRERYVHVRTWMRSPIYYLSAFQRRDLWELGPAEVLIEIPASPTPGPQATFANGVELLGGEIESSEVVERHEVFVTTWWRVPGPRSPDLLFFVHLERQLPPRTQASLDHPAGDWLYPANRWEAGQEIEDRVLVQIPVGLVPGTYDVQLGMFDRRTGERVPVTEGESSEDRRVHLGTLEIRPMRHLLDPLIPRTDPAQQRRRLPAPQP